MCRYNLIFQKNVYKVDAIRYIAADVIRVYKYSINMPIVIENQRGFYGESKLQKEGHPEEENHGDQKAR